MQRSSTTYIPKDATPEISFFLWQMARRVFVQSQLSFSFDCVRDTITNL